MELGAFFSWQLSSISSNGFLNYERGRLEGCLIKIWQQWEESGYEILLRLSGYSFYFPQAHWWDIIQTCFFSQVSPLLADEDVFSALDGVLERISDLQQLVISWSENISEDDCQRGSSSSSHDSPAHGSPCPASPSHIHLEVQHPEGEEEEEEDCSEKGTDVLEMSGSPQPKRRWV